MFKTRKSRVIALVIVGVVAVLVGLGFLLIPGTSDGNSAASPAKAIVPVTTTPSVPSSTAVAPTTTPSIVTTTAPPKQEAPVPAPPKPPAFTLEAANKANLSKERVELFGRLSIRPGTQWDGTMSEPEVIVRYADRTTCTGSDAGCPHISFVNLASSAAASVYGKNPLQVWSTAKGSCGFQKVEGPVAATIGGRPAQLYKQRCDDKTAAPRYAWLIPGQTVRCS